MQVVGSYVSEKGGISLDTYDKLMGVFESTESDNLKKAEKLEKEIETDVKKMKSASEEKEEKLNDEVSKKSSEVSDLLTKVKPEKGSADEKKKEEILNKLSNALGEKDNNKKTT